jgi:hypothetical protein
MILEFIVYARAGHKFAVSVILVNDLLFIYAILCYSDLNELTGFIRAALMA